MDNFKRFDDSLSLCGLNCALCLMKIGGYCPGCGHGAGNQSCAIARCSLDKNIQYCFECSHYPCDKYHNITQYDSFITHQNQLKDFEKVQQIGLSQYHLELKEKVLIFQYLLENYNDGRRKSFFSLACNLLDVDDLKDAIKEIELQTHINLSLKDKAILASEKLQQMANQNAVVLKLNKRKKT